MNPLISRKRIPGRVESLLLAFALLALLALFLWPDRVKKDDPAAPPGAWPAEPANARLLAQRPDGIHLLTPGRAGSEKLVARGSWPRWAPDGQSFAFVRENEIWIYSFADRTEHRAATAARARAVAFHPAGTAVYFTDGSAIRSVDLASGRVADVWSGDPVLELDVAPDVRFFAATLRSRGFRVVRIPPDGGAWQEVSRGCSANISPDGSAIAVNLRGQRKLALHDPDTGREIRILRAPDGMTLDNQSWSNHPDWIAAVTGEAPQNIVLQQVSNGQVWTVTDGGDFDRPDLFVER